MAHAQLNSVLGHIRRLAAPPAADCLTDAQLLERFLVQDDQAAFAALVKRYGPLVQKVCWRVLHHAQDVEDAFQATFLILARNAASIRQRATLASWLHGAAYRTALRAKRDAGRRRRHEREAQRMSNSQPPLDAAWRELQALLDEEIANLPEKYRVVFVLCCLESKRKSEAGVQLGLKEGTVSSRLAHARKLLQKRLTRRGLTLSAVLGAVAVSEKSSQAALSAGLVRATTKAALGFRAQQGGAISANVTKLAEGVSQAMLFAKYKTATVILLTVGLLAVSAGVFAQRHAAAESPSKPPTQSRETPAAEKVVAKPNAEAAAVKGETLTVTGRVLDPQGRPFAGAEVTMWWHLGYEGYYRMWHPQTVKPLKPRFGAISDADGRFRFSFSPSEIQDGPMNMWDGWWKSTQVVAAAKGYGPGWVLLRGLDKGELTIRLVEDNAPIKRRIVDLQGRPAAGARVRGIHLDCGGDFIKDFLWQTSWAGLSAKSPTDKDGEFTLTGLGGGRKVLVLVEGPTIAHQFISIDTSTKAEREKTKSAPSGDVVAQPTKPIEGTIRAKDTGEPLAGIVVYGNEDAQRRKVRAITDEKGHYRLVGLPKAAQYQLTVYCPATQSYLGTFRKLADSEGLKPITADFGLRRGIPIQFRMIDKETRRPVRGTVQYTPLQCNPLYSEAGSEFFPTREMERIHMPDPKGVFRLVAYPGPGIVLAWAKYGRPYLPARPTPAETEHYIKGTFMLGGYVTLSEGYRILDTDKLDKPLTFDIELDPGRTLKGRLVGPDSRPVAAATADGLDYNAVEARHGQTRGGQLLATEDFTVLRLEPSTSRTISFVHRERKLIGHLVLRGDEKDPLTIRLESWGTLTGRLVDEQGKPLANVRVDLRGPSLPAPGLGSLQEFRTDKEGRFRVEGLLPGLNHELILSHGTQKIDFALSAGEAMKKWKARAGEVKELGEIPVKVAPVPTKEKKNG